MHFTLLVFSSGLGTGIGRVMKCIRRIERGDTFLILEPQTKHSLSGLNSSLYSATSITTHDLLRLTDGSLLREREMTMMSRVKQVSRPHLHARIQYISDGQSQRHRVPYKNMDVILRSLVPIRRQHKL